MTSCVSKTLKNTKTQKHNFICWNNNIKRFRNAKKRKENEKTEHNNAKKIRKTQFCLLG
jgi:hypothetical protein